MRRFPPTWLLCAVLLASPFSVGQSPVAEPSAVPAKAPSTDNLAEYHRLRQLYLNKLKELRREAYDKHVAKLLEMERGFVAAKNYSAAAQAKAAREAAAREFAESAESPSGATGGEGEWIDGAVLLKGENAVCGGGVLWDAQRGALVGWKSEKAYARWRLPQGLTTGGYDVELTYACASGSGGRVIFKESFHTLTRSVKDAGSWESYTTENYGTLRVRAGSATFEITAAMVRGDGLFFLKSVRLLPSTIAKS